MANLFETLRQVKNQAVVRQAEGWLIKGEISRKTIADYLPGVRARVNAFSEEYTRAIDKVHREAQNIEAHREQLLMGVDTSIMSTRGSHHPVGYEGYVFTEPVNTPDPMNTARTLVPDVVKVFESDPEKAAEISAKLLIGLEYRDQGESFSGLDVNDDWRLVCRIVDPRTSTVFSRIEFGVLRKGTEEQREKVYRGRAEGWVSSNLKDRVVNKSVVDSQSQDFTTAAIELGYVGNLQIKDYQHLSRAIINKGWSHLSKPEEIDALLTELGIDKKLVDRRRIFVNDKMRREHGFHGLPYVLTVRGNDFYTPTIVLSRETREQGREAFAAKMTKGLQKEINARVRQLSSGGTVDLSPMTVINAVLHDQMMQGDGFYRRDVEYLEEEERVMIPLVTEQLKQVIPSEFHKRLGRWSYAKQHPEESLPSTVAPPIEVNELPPYIKRDWSMSTDPADHELSIHVVQSPR